MPVPTFDYQPLPFAEPRHTPNTTRLQAIYGDTGSQLAQLALQRGQAQSEGLGRLASIISGGASSAREGRARKEAIAIRAAEQDAERKEREAERAARAAERAADKLEREAATATATKTREADAAYRRGGDIAETVQSGPLAESQVDDVMAGPAAGRARYAFGPGTSEGPELTPSPQQVQRNALTSQLERMGYTIGPNGQALKTTPDAPRPVSVPDGGRLVDPSTGKVVYTAPARTFAPPRGGGGSGTSPPVTPVVTASDPDSQDIMSQAGLSYNGFLAVTGEMSKLGRDSKTRAAAAKEVQDWARSKGIDVSTLQSQFKGSNEVLKRNIMRFNKTLMAEGEIQGDVANLMTAAQEAGLNDVRAINAAKLWLKGELNDPGAATYAMHLNQLRNDLALYNSASRDGGGEVLLVDIEAAETTIKQGIGAGSLKGIETATSRSVEKMRPVLEAGVNRARKDVWTLFGVGDKFKPVTRGDKPGAAAVSGGATEGETRPIDGYPGTEQTFRNGKWIRTK